MLKKIGLTLFFAATSISTSAYSVSNYTLLTATSMVFKFPPHEPQLLHNQLYWPISADCTISTKDHSDELQAKAIKNTGTVNGINLIVNAGYFPIIVRSGEILHITAESRARIEIMNMGNEMVIAKCISI